MNGKINQLRSDLTTKEGELDSANKRINDLEKALTDCQNREPEKIVETVVETTVNKAMESMVTFRQGRFTIDASTS